MIEKLNLNIKNLVRLTISFARLFVLKYTKEFNTYVVNGVATIEKYQVEFSFARW
jgi:hypothetical protein